MKQLELEGSWGGIEKEHWIWKQQKLMMMMMFLLMSAIWAVESDQYLLIKMCRWSMDNVDMYPHSKYFHLFFWNLALDIVSRLIHNPLTFLCIGCQSMLKILAFLPWRNFISRPWFCNLWFLFLFNFLNDHFFVRVKEINKIYIFNKRVFLVCCVLISTLILKVL